MVFFRRNFVIRRLCAFEIWIIWRRMMKVPWTEHKINKEILQMVETESEIMDIVIRRRQKRWLGHILRHDSLLRITLEGQIQGKKAYGRPRTMLLDWLLKTEEGNISYEELKMFAQDRSRWSQWRWKPAIWQNTAERIPQQIVWFAPNKDQNVRRRSIYHRAGWKVIAQCQGREDAEIVFDSNSSAYMIRFTVMFYSVAGTPTVPRTAYFNVYSVL